MITLENVSKTYQLSEEVEVHACININLVIHDGEDIAIVGKSGSGKTTLMNMITCIDDISDGHYQLNEHCIEKQNKNKLADIRNKHFGFIYQNFNLLNNLTAYENIELALIYSKTPGHLRKEKIMDIAQKVGIIDRLSHKPSELSGGEKQRVAIARALINDPEVIIADEPTGALDEQTGQQIIEFLKQLNEKGTTLIIVTHDMDIAKLSKRTIILADGAIISDEGGTSL